MRCVALVVIVALALVGKPHADDLDDDLDLDGLDLDDDEGGDNADGGQPFPVLGASVPDFDLAMPDKDRKVRMTSCLAHTMARIENMPKEEIKLSVEAIVKQKAVSEDQAMNMIVYMLMMTCYMQIDEESARLGVKLSAEQEKLVFNPENPAWNRREGDSSQSVQQASKRQWKLLEEVLNDGLENSEQQKEQKQKEQLLEELRTIAKETSHASGKPATDPVPTSQFGMLYVLGAFGVLFGLGFVALKYLIAKDEERPGKADRERSGKSLKKAEKAQRQNAKKQM